MIAPSHSPIQTVVFQSDPPRVETMLLDGVLCTPAVTEEFDRFVRSG